ncbi:MAG: SusC/RagA family TonB-linked outer membrane protein [Gemmatimonadales bacterium]
MKELVRPRLAFVSCAVLLSGLFSAGTANAQASVITGKVTNQQGAPIVGANVVLLNMGLGAAVSSTGTYSITVPEDRASGQQASLIARFIGFTPETRTIRLSRGPQTMDFVLQADPFRLSEVVVTGVSSETSQKKLTISVARISEEQIRQVPASSPVAALAGKVSGAKINIGSGNPGAAPTIRLRGSTNLGIGNSSPIIIVDGVLTRNSIADIDANDIESIEVLKGAAGASFYGSDAANGVINITTKRGRNLPENKVAFTMRNEVGTSSLQRYVPLSTAHGYLTNPDGSYKLNAAGGRIPKPDAFLDVKYPTDGPNRFRNQLKEWMGDGTFMSTNLQLGMRRGNTNFNTSYTADHNAGILPLTKGQYRQNLRLNVDQGLGDKADFSSSVTYGVNRNDYDPNNAQSWFELMQMPPDINLRNPNGDDTVAFFPRIPTAASPSMRQNPLYILNNNDFKLRRERIIGSLSARYRPWEWLRFEAAYGTDRLNRAETDYNRRGSLGEGGQPIQGDLSRFTQNNVSDNSTVNATITKKFGELVSTTRGAYLYEQGRLSQFFASGSRFNVTDVPDLAGLDPTQLALSSQEEVQRSSNFLVSQSLDFRDRYLLDVLGRSDGSSLFGEGARRNEFYRVSGAYRLGEDLKIKGIQELKLRAARGTAGLRPEFLDQYEYYTLTGGQFSKTQLGNKSLKPAIQTENEFGLNTSFLDRFDLEIVQANRLTKGAFLNIPLSLAASGGFQTQVQNAADVEARTTELALQTRVIDRPDFSYSFSLTGDHTTQKILRLGRAAFRVNAGGQGQDVFYYKEGENLGIIYGTKWVRTFAELKDNPANANVVETDYVVNPLGFLVLAANRGKPGEAPIKYISPDGLDQHTIGDVNPDLNFGFANNVRFKGFSLYALFDGQRGGDVYNFTKQWMLQDLRHGDMDMSDKPQDQKVAVGFFTGSVSLYNGLVANDYLVEDGSYVKLRELSVGYTLGDRLLHRTGLSRLTSGVKLALIGRNLYTWTSYTGFDPEVTAGNDFNFRIDGFRYPNFRTVTGQIELSF